MANQLLTISMITNEGLRVLENELTFADRVNRQYDERFGVEGAKIGYTVNVRKPPRFIGTTGPNLSVEDFYESSVPVTLTTQFHVDVQFTEADRLLSLDDFSGRVIKPAVAAIANKVDRDGTTTAFQWTSNAVGTPGTPVASRAPLLQAGAYLDSEAAPRDGMRSAVLDQWTTSYMVDALAGLFNPQSQISEQYRKGLLAKNTLGFDVYMDQNIVSYTPGAGGGTPVVSGAGQGIATGWSQTGTLLTSGWSNSTNVLNVGDVITLAGVYAVNPQNRAAYGSNRLRQFVVRPFSGTPSAGTYNAVTGQYTSSGSGTLQLQLSPAIITSGQFQNVSAAPAASAAITILGSSSVTSPQNLAFHRDAFTLAMADLPLPGGVDFAGRAADKQTGMSIRVVRQYTVNNDSLPCRFDVLYGWAPLYPELSVRIAG